MSETDKQRVETGRRGLLWVKVRKRETWKSNFHFHATPPPHYFARLGERKENEKKNSSVKVKFVDDEPKKQYLFLFQHFLTPSRIFPGFSFVTLQKSSPISFSSFWNEKKKCFENKIWRHKNHPRPYRTKPTTLTTIHKTQKPFFVPHLPPPPTSQKERGSVKRVVRTKEREREELQGH